MLPRGRHFASGMFQKQCLVLVFICAKVAQNTRTIHKWNRASPAVSGEPQRKAKDDLSDGPPM